MTEPIRVLIADDEMLIRAGFGPSSTPAGMIVVGEAADGAAAVDLARQTHPDVVLMDIRMPGVDGLDATRQITEAADLAWKCTCDPHDLRSRRVRHRGAGCRRQRVCDQEHRSPANCCTASRSWRAAKRHGFAARPDPPAGCPACPPGPEPPGQRWGAGPAHRAGREVAGLVAHGMSNHEIAEHLVIGPATAKTHVQPGHGQTRCPRPRTAGRAGLPAPAGRPA